MYLFFGISGDPPRRIFNQMRASSKSIHQFHGGELLVTNNKRCDPPLAEDEVRKIASSVCRYKPAGEEAFR
jgi:hypothetical protein